MKKFSLFLVFSFYLLYFFSCKKNRTQISEGNANVFTSATPLIDFGDATYRGFQGGLYPNGLNQRPPSHTAAGLAIAQTIRPLNVSGNADANGKIVWLSIGMSNTTQETQAFLSLMDTYPDKNPKLTLVDGAVGGQGINEINNPAATYWNSVDTRLNTAGLSASQVQVIWFKEAEKTPSDTSFITYPDALKQKFNSVMQILKSKFPNLKLCYLSSRIYGGYAATKENPEPYAWYSGWTVKRLIADQISGDASLRYSGSNPSAAWLSWGPYTWANGSTPRSDGLVWLRSDFEADGTHPNMQGRQKVAQMLLQFFSTDETTKPWFLK